MGIGLVGLLTFKFGLKLPYRKLLVVTGFLVVTIMVSFIGQTVRLFQTVGWISVHPIPGVHIPDWAGLWLGLYPSWEGFFIPPLALVYVGGAWLFTRWRSAVANRELASSGAPERHSPAKKLVPKNETNIARTWPRVGLRNIEKPGGHQPFPGTRLCGTRCAGITNCA